MLPGLPVALLSKLPTKQETFCNNDSPHHRVDKIDRQGAGGKPHPCHSIDANGAEMAEIERNDRIIWPVIFQDTNVEMVFFL